MNAFDLNSLNIFNIYIHYPAYFYSIGIEKFEATRGNSLPIKKCLEEASSNYKALLSYRFGYDLRKEPDIEKKKDILKFLLFCF